MHSCARSLRQKINDGNSVLGSMLLEYPTPATVGLFADAGFDFLIFDGEHGHLDPRAVEACIEAAYHAGVAVLLRPADIARSPITWALDAGAAGVLIPAVETLDEVRRVVRFTKYRPVGRRGVHLFRGHTHHRSVDPATFMTESNADTLTLIQIETAAAAAIVDEIAAVPGVDGLYVGPADLSVDLGVPGQWEAPVVLNAIRNVAGACRARGKISACHTNDVETMPRLQEIGFSMIGYSCDIGIMKERVDALGGAFRAACGAPR